jgi:hypothetical protein
MEYGNAGNLILLILKSLEYTLGFLFDFFIKL